MRDVGEILLLREGFDELGELKWAELIPMRQIRIVDGVDEAPKFAKLVIKTLNAVQSTTEDLFFRFILLVLGVSLIPALTISNKKRS
jgi:hypothetical protein